MRFCFLYLIALLLSIELNAQSTMTGKVTDEITGAGLAGVSVYIQDLLIGDATDLDGNYTVKNVPKGWHKVQFSYVGYETKIMQLSFEDGDVELNVSLHTTVTETHEVVISGGYISSQDENAVKIDVMDMKDIQQNGGNTLMENLSENPGINQLSTGTAIGKPVIRGLTGNRVLVVYDGFRQENQQWGAEHGLGVSEYGLDRVEVIKGPASLLYGSDALGGVLHLIREQSVLEGEIKGDVQTKVYDNTNGIGGSVGIQGNKSGILWGLRASSSIHGDYIDGAGNRIGNSRFKDQNISLNTGLIRKWGIIKVNYDRYSQLIGLPGIETLSDDAGYNMLPPFQDIVQQNLSLKTSYFFKNTKLRMNFATEENRRKEYEVKDSASLDMKLKTYLADIKIEHSFKDKTEFILGIQGMHQTNVNSGIEFLIPDALTENVGVYSMIKHTLKEVSLQAGLRYDISDISNATFLYGGDEIPQNKLNFSSYSAALGATYDVSKSMLIRANVARGFRSPNLSELLSAGVHEGAKRYEVGNVNLRNENNLEFDLSSHVHSEHLNAEIAGFYNIIADYIYLNPTGNVFVSSTDSVPIYIYEQTDAHLFGGELTFDFHPHPIDWLHYELTFETVTGIDKNNQSLPLVPANSVNNEFIIEKPVGRKNKAFFKVGFKYVFEQNKVAEFETESAAYELLSAGLGGEFYWKEQLVTLGITAKNLLNKKYISHLSRLKSQGILDQGRSFIFYLKIPFQVSKATIK